MAGKDNLIPEAHKLTVDEQSRGGKASGKARREKRDLRKAVEALFEQDFYDQYGNMRSGAELIVLKQFEKAIKGNTKAFEVLRDTAGQKPIEKVQLSEVDMDIAEEVEKAVKASEAEARKLLAKRKKTATRKSAPKKPATKKDNT